MPGMMWNTIQMLVIYWLCSSEQQSRWENGCSLFEGSHILSREVGGKWPKKMAEKGASELPGEIKWLQEKYQTALWGSSEKRSTKFCEVFQRFFTGMPVIEWVTTTQDHSLGWGESKQAEKPLTQDLAVKPRSKLPHGLAAKSPFLLQNTTTPAHS